MTDGQTNRRTGKTGNADYKDGRIITSKDVAHFECRTVRGISLLVYTVISSGLRWRQLDLYELF